jgi:flagellar biosynthesis protein FlhF
MSTTAPATTNGHHRKLDGVRTYRGRKLEDLIPKIRAELGPDAIILREREGLMGGINGFFAQRFVEVQARAAASRVDVYDDEDELESMPAQPSATSGPATPPSAVNDELSPAESFARQLEEAASAAFDDFGLDHTEPEPEPALPETAVPEPAVPEEVVAVPEPERATPVPAAEPVVKEPVPAKPRPARRQPAHKPRRGPSGRFVRALGGAGQTKAPAAEPSRQADASVAAAVARALVDAGISDAWACRLIGEAGAHAAPFARQGGLQSAVRVGLASSIVHGRPLPASGAAVAFVGAGGAGKTRCTATLATAYKRASTLSVSAISLASGDGGRELAELLRAQGVSVAAGKTGSELARRVEKARRGGLVVIDTPAVAPGDGEAVQALAAELEPLALDAVYIVLPATLGAQTGHRLLAGLAPLHATGLALSHADETDQLGIAVELAFVSRIPVNYIHEGLDLETAISAVDPVGLAERLLP